LRDSSTDFPQEFMTSNWPIFRFLPAGCLFCRPGDGYYWLAV